MRILYTTEYKGDKICGVWTRIKNESEYMKQKGHEVIICAAEDFGPVFRISDNASLWNMSKFKKYIRETKPDIIVCNTYRHLETNTALVTAIEIGIPCCLVTHAPFLEQGVRKWYLNAAASIYDHIFNRISQFSKVFAISRWEKPYLDNLGARNRVYLPNAIPDELFKDKPNKLSLKSRKKISKKKILFLGRIAPIKDIPTLLRAIAINKLDYTLTLAGPFEKEYKDYLMKIAEELNIQDKICFIGSVNTIEYKMDLIRQHDIFVLPSLREGMPQALLEAMALGKIVISSRNQGAIEIVKDGKNGFLFDISDPIQLSNLLHFIKLASHGTLNAMSKAARKTASEFAANKIYPKTEQIYLSLISNNN